MKSALKIPLVSFVVALLSSIIALVLDLISVIDLSVPMTLLLEENGITSTANYSQFSPWFQIWSAASFVMYSSESLIGGSFDLGYIILFVLSVISAVVIGFLSDSKVSGIITYVVYLLFNLIIAMTAALILPNTIRFGALTPADQELVRNMTGNLITLSLLVPFVVYLIAFLANIAVGVVIVFLLAGRNDSKK